MRKPTGCIEENPTTQSVKFCGQYINLSEISRTQGVQPSSISRIFAGTRRPSLKSAIKIAQALEMRVDAFLAALEKHTGVSATKAPGAVDSSISTASRSRRKDQGARRSEKAKGATPTPDEKSELIEIVRNSKLSWYDRGQAVDHLYRQCEMNQDAIADLAGISKETISKQRIIFVHLRGSACEMCRSHKMHADAACLLAHAISKDANLKQESVMARAVAFSEERDRDCLRQGKGLKGRRTLTGQITYQDMNAALLDERCESEFQPVR